MNPMAMKQLGHPAAECHRLLEPLAEMIIVVRRNAIKGVCPQINPGSTASSGRLVKMKVTTMIRGGYMDTILRSGVGKRLNVKWTIAPTTRFFRM
jgi:hypothetical protein